ncbi:MAG: hypothetical protein QXE79_03250 [Candidatus Bathyarchaeia archaeon]
MVNEMPRRKRREIDPITIIIALILAFLIGKFLSLWRAFNIDPFGVEPEWVYGVLALGIGVLYKEIRDLGKEVRRQLQKINDNLSGFGERIARLEALVEKRGISVN